MEHQNSVEEKHNKIVPSLKFNYKLITKLTLWLLIDVPCKSIILVCPVLFRNQLIY